MDHNTTLEFYLLHNAGQALAALLVSSFNTCPYLQMHGTRHTGQNHSAIDLSTDGHSRTFHVWSLQSQQESDETPVSATAGSRLALDAHWY